MLDISNIIFLKINDNGTGFNYDENLILGNGIINMRNRTELLGGKFELITSKENGTKILISINKITSEK